MKKLRLRANQFRKYQQGGGVDAQVEQVLQQIAAEYGEEVAQAVLQVMQETGASVEEALQYVMQQVQQTQQVEGQAMAQAQAPPPPPPPGMRYGGNIYMVPGKKR